MAPALQGLQPALKGAILSVQRIFITVFTGFYHLYSNLYITQCLLKGQRRKTQRNEYKMNKSMMITEFNGDIDCEISVYIQVPYIQV